MTDRAIALPQREDELRGHGRYRDRQCGDPRYLRNAIVYTHLNPVRAGLCKEVGDYPWSSRAGWATGRPEPGAPPLALTRAAPLFASAEPWTQRGLYADYVAVERWRHEGDRLREHPEMAEEATPLLRPITTAGDAYWMDCLVPGGEGAAAHPTLSQPHRAMDLAAVAAAVLRESEPGLHPSLVRSRWGGPAYVRARHRIIRRSAAIGFRGVQVAAYLRISTSAVSDVLAAARKRAILERT